MLNSLKETGKSIGREINHAWETLSDGWREMLSRSSNALTHFGRRKSEMKEQGHQEMSYPHWGLLAGEVEETASDLVVRVEMPGMNKEDCDISIDGNVLNLSGEKHSEREHRDSTYHVMERAYGAFQRSIQLPRNVDKSKATATYMNGVLTVRLPKVEGSDGTKSIPVT